MSFQKTDNIYINDIILNQINLAKSHGIFGFAIYYDSEYNKEDYNQLLDIFLENKTNYFSFLIIWKNNNFKNNLLKMELEKFIKNIKKYLISLNYIRINNKPAIMINHPLIFKNINETILILREKAKENGIGDLFFFLHKI